MHIMDAGGGKASLFEKLVLETVTQLKPSFTSNRVCPGSVVACVQFTNEFGFILFSN